MSPSPSSVRHREVLPVVATGGVIGAEARYGLGRALSHSGRQFPWSTLLVNVSGCLMIGALMVLLLELTSPHRLARPFLGTGILGGYTTFSTFSVDIVTLVRDDRPTTALVYLGATVVCCALAVLVSTAATQAAGRAIIGRRVRRRRGGRS